MKRLGLVILVGVLAVQANGQLFIGRGSLSDIVSRANGSVVPLSLSQGETAINSETASDGSAVVSLRFYSDVEEFDFEWTPKPSGSQPLGSFVLRHRLGQWPRPPLSFMRGAQIDWVAPAALKDSTVAVHEGDATMTSSYSINGIVANVTVKASIENKSLVLDVSCDQPLITSLSCGDWSPTPSRKISVPYLELPVCCLANGDLFGTSFADWTYSRASSLNGATASYRPKTNGALNLVRERFVWTAALYVYETFPNIPNPPSPYRSELAKGIVLDVWGPDFDTVRKKLHAVAEMGLGHADVIIHDWQHKGYDNALPDHYPANPKLGGSAAMIRLVDEAKKDGFRISLHENYVDYYPNYFGFKDFDIAKNSDGKRVLAWLNEGTHVQSFAEKPTRMLALSGSQSPAIKRLYGSNACYLDVHSAVPPWFHVDFDAADKGAGMFRAVLDAHRALWQYERALFGGPVFGEGNDHWYWSGFLDGVEAQPGVGTGYSSGKTMPLIVDFDLLKIHPLQLNHGMGYYNRWWDKAPQPGRDTLEKIDQYRMQEIAFGHEGFLDNLTWSNPALAWEESHLLEPVTRNLALIAVEDIGYEKGPWWQDLSDAIRKGGNLSRVRVRYQNGVTAWANGSDESMVAEKVSLPAHGWFVKGHNLEAGQIALPDAEQRPIAVSFSKTPESEFVNVRSPAWRSSAMGISAIQPTVTFHAKGPRSFVASYRWQVGTALGQDYTCFVHFTDSSGHGIRFQQDHKSAIPTSSWHPGQTVFDGPWTVNVPRDLPDGDYSWMLGLYNSSGRLTLDAPQDGEQRALLGTIHVRGDDVTFAPGPAGPLPLDTNVHSSVLQVEDIKTDGSVWIHKEGHEWVLLPFESGNSLNVYLASTRFGSPALVKAGSKVVKPVYDGKWWRLPMTGAHEYRWPAK